MSGTQGPYALLGRVVTMDARSPDEQDRVIDDGVIYVRDGMIVDVMEENSPPPEGFGDCPRVKTRGTIYPGLIELHNHISYNILPLWNVSGTFANNGQWRDGQDKRKYISGPMALLNEAGGYLGAIVRYVECKCLVAGVTTTQGITLMNAGGIEKKYRGIVRNVEEPDHPKLPKAGHRINDVDGTDPRVFLKGLQSQKGCFLLHLSEGIDPTARKHFLALQFPDKTGWAITDALGGIHSAGLWAEDFQILKQGNGSVVWSPLSNLMLYGDTAKVRAAKACEVLIALGSDWSPSGSKNLLGELKIARLYSQLNGDIFSDVELVRMVTSTPARMLKWFDLLGSIEKNKIADLVVMAGQKADPFDQLLTSSETDVRLVVIGGVPRYGTGTLMRQLDQKGEGLTINGRAWVLNLDGAPDADVSTLTLKQAHDRLAAGLAALPNPPSFTPAPIADAFGDVSPVIEYKLVLDNDGAEANESRPLSPLTTADVIAEAWAAAVDLHTIVEPLVLDELTIAENSSKYVDMLIQQRNLPQEIKDKLSDVYGA